MKNLGLILGLVNTVVVAAVLGLFVYTKMVYKRPAITEEQQRKRFKKPDHPVEANHTKGMIMLEPITVNLDPYKDPDGKEALHYVAMTLAVETRNEKENFKFEEIKPFVQDQIIQQLGKKKFEDLNQVQGRYLFRSLIIDATNDYLKEPVVTEVYFADFLLQ